MMMDTQDHLSERGKNQLTREQSRLAALARYGILDTSAEPAFDALAAQLCATEMAAISFLDDERVWPKACVGLPRAQIPSKSSLCAHAVQLQRPLVVPDAAADPRFSDGVLVAEAPFVRFYAAVPLTTEMGLCLGTLAVFDAQPRASASEAELDGLTKLALLVVQLLQDRQTERLLLQLRQRAARVESLQSAVAAADGYEAALSAVLTELCRYHSAAIGRIWKLSMPSETMIEVNRYVDDRLNGADYFRLQPHVPISSRNMFTAEHIRSNKPGILYYADLPNPEHNTLVQAAVAAGLVGQISYPIWVQGEHFGIALAFSAYSRPLDEVLADIASLEDLIRPALLRKITEERLLLLGQVLERSRDGVLIAQVGPDGHSDGVIIYANAGFCQMMGYSLDEVIGKILLLAGPDTDPASSRRCLDAVRNNVSLRLDVLNYRCDGAPIWVELELLPIKDERGVTTHWVRIRRDITQRRFQDEVIARTEKLKTLGQLTGGIAHDFNNLLTVVTLNIEEAIRTQDDDSPLLRLLQPAMHASIRGADLTGQLLAYARCAPLRPERIQLDTVITGLQPLLRRSLGEQYELAVKLRDTDIAATVDTGQLENALMNLIINARDSMPNGGRILLETEIVHLSAGNADLHDDTMPGRYARISVTDHGEGIPAAILARVFDPFFTTKPVGRGSGLGLSMVYGFARQSGGSTTIASTPGRGTVASLLLPISQELPQAAPTSRRIDRWHAVGRSVLVVEDQPEVLTTVLHLLEHLDFQTTGTTTADAAAERLRRGETFDLLFSDIVLPGSINGLELAHLAKQMAPDMKILITTGFTQQSVPLTDTLRAGAEFLTKPYKRQDLVDRLRVMFPSG